MPAQSIHVALTPVAAHRFDSAEEDRLDRIANSLAEKQPLIAEQRRIYAPHLPSGRAGGRFATLQIDDSSAIAHVEGVLGLEYYSSRAYARARHGDIVAQAFPEIPGYLDYQAQRLGLGRPICCPVDPDPDLPPFHLVSSLLADYQAQGRIAQAAAASGDVFWIHPYMGHEGVWRLAGSLQSLLPMPVRVLAPLPAVTQLANSKTWLAQTIRTVLGDDWALDARHAQSVSEAVRLLRAYSSCCSKLCLKLSDSATGLGTGIFASEEIGRMSDSQLPSFVEAWLEEMEWTPQSLPISVERWEDAVCSPSVQLWIPPLGQGAIVNEGVYQQTFYPGQAHVYMGSRPSRLPASVESRLGEACLRLARVFQGMGYAGRCSFDSILCGSEPESARIAITECNGRWGGTSTPMSMMNRLFGDYRRQPYVASDFVDRRLEGVAFPDFVAALDDVLWSRGGGEGWAIVYNVGCLADYGKLDVVALGGSLDQAEERLESFRTIIRDRL